MSNVFNDFNSNNCLFLPLGTEIDRDSVPQKKLIEIIFAGHIKDTNRLYQEINLLPDKHKHVTKNIIDMLMADLNQSFISVFSQVNNLNLSRQSQDDIKLIFRYSNSYIRAYKRKLVINSIKNISITIHGIVDDKKISSKKNITVKPQIPYYVLSKLYANSKFSINVSPNFNFSCHDRIIHSISNGACCITDRNPYLEKFFNDMENIIFYDFNFIDNIDYKINYLLKNNLEESIQKKGFNVVMNYFSWKTIISRLIYFMNIKLGKEAIRKT